jgi:hypothetical protein
MGRPLNKRFFGDPAGAGEQVACNAWFGGASAASFIIEQRSNSLYRVGDLATTASDGLTAGVTYQVLTVGGADYTLVGGLNQVGTVFTSTGTNEAGAGGTVNETDLCRLVDRTPAATGEMQVVVTIENAETPRQATVTVTSGGGAITAVDILDAGYGYWAGNTGVSVGTGTGTIDYTVDGNGSLLAISSFTAGATNPDGANNIGDAPAGTPPLENARIINARTVKTFGPAGNVFDWPIVAPLGPATPGGRTQADIGS